MNLFVDLPPDGLFIACCLTFAITLGFLGSAILIVGVLLGKVPLENCDEHQKEEYENHGCE